MPARTRTSTGSPDGPGAILAIFREHPDGLTKSEAARLSGLSRSAVNQRIERLVQHRLLRLAGSESQTGGRPADLFEVDRDLGVLLIADVGATGMRVALCDVLGGVGDEHYETLDIADGPAVVLPHIVAAFGELLAARGASAGDVRGIGVTLPGPIDSGTGRPVSPPIMPGWHDHDVPRAFADFDCPVVVERDAAAMAFGERQRMHPESDNLVFVKLGTGIATGIIANGEIYRGENGAAGDLGHIPYVGVGAAEGEAPLCRCGNRGCFEAYASGWALARDLRALGYPVESVNDVVGLVQEGNPDAVRLVRAAAQIFGTAISDVVSFLNPGVIVIGNQLAALGDSVIAVVREVVYGRSLPLATRDLRIAPSRLEDRAGVLGIAELTSERVLSPAAVDELLDGAGRSASAS